MLGALPEILAQRGEIAIELPKFDVSLIDKMEDYAMALSHAHTLYATAAESPDDLQAIAQEAVETRDRLHADATALCVRGLVSASALKDYKGLVGYKNAACDLQILVSILKQAWPQIEGKCATQLAELDRADKVAMRILRVVGLRDQAPAVVAAPADNRARAFSIFIHAYDEVRRAVAYLRWSEGDADSIAPSLYAGRKRKPVSDLAQPAPALAPTPAPAVVGPVQQPAPTGASKPATVGLPGSNPFMS